MNAGKAVTRKVATIGYEPVPHEEVFFYRAYPSVIYNNDITI